MKYIIQILILSTLLFSASEVATKDDIKTLIQYMDKKFEAMQHNMDKRFESNQHNMDKRFESMDKRFESMQHNMDTRFKEISNNIYALMGLIGIIFSVIMWDRRSMMEVTIRHINEDVKKVIKKNNEIQNELLLTKLLKKADKKILDKALTTIEEIYKENKQLREIYNNHNIKFSS